MKTIITGTSNGIGLATAKKFLACGHEVYGIDIVPHKIEHALFRPILADVSDAAALPEIEGVEILVNNAATADEGKAISVNLGGYINVTEKYAMQDRIKCIINIGSTSGRNGLDKPRYSASQGGRIAYTKNTAIRLGNKYRARVICLSFGAVLTTLEPQLYKDPELVKAVADESLLKKWIQPEEAAEWVYFLACVDKSCTSQDILVDNGEEGNFNWIEAK